MVDDTLNRAVQAAAEALTPMSVRLIGDEREFARIAVEAAAPILYPAQCALTLKERDRAERAEAEVERLRGMEETARRATQIIADEVALADRLAEALRDVADRGQNSPGQPACTVLRRCAECSKITALAAYDEARNGGLNAEHVLADRLAEAMRLAKKQWVSGGNWHGTLATALAAYDEARRG